MEGKKVTRSQLERRINNAVVFIPKDKETKSIWFNDKGVRLTATDENAIIETNYHKHVFYKITGSGVSRPWLYTRRVIDIALENEQYMVDDANGYSLRKLIDFLKSDESKTSEYNILVKFEWYLFNVFQPLYGLGESEIETFLLYESYLHNIAVNKVILDERTNDLTSSDFIENVISNLKEYTKDIVSFTLIKKATDEDVVQENIKALSEINAEEIAENGIE